MKTCLYNFEKQAYSYLAIFIKLFFLSFAHLPKTSHMDRTHD